MNTQTKHFLLSLTSIVALGLPVTANNGDPNAISALPTGSSWSISGDHHSWTSARPDSHAPIGVMADHVHGEGEWMLSLRYMRMEMEGSRDGTRRLSDQEVLSQGYMVTPTEMTMEMWMLGAMYAPSDSVTLMAMVPYLRNDMSHLTGMGGTFDTQSEGFGDTRIGALIPVWRTDSGTLAHIEAGVSLPTGSTSERDATPANPDAKLPYPMQLGSGTYDLILGGTLQRQFDAFSLGGQARGILRLGENDEDYSLGDRVEATAWGAWRFVDQVSGSLRLAYANWGNIDGADPELNPNMVPTARPDLRGGERLDLGVGVNSELGAGWRLAAEALWPIHQDLDGPQLETDVTYILGLQISF